MRSLGPSDFLTLWERGRTLHPLDRSLLAVHAAFPEVSYEAVADWPIGRRNRALAALRTAAFGPGIGGWTDCPECREKLEFDIDVCLWATGKVSSSWSPYEWLIVSYVEGRAFRMRAGRPMMISPREVLRRI